MESTFDGGTARSRNRYLWMVGVALGVAVCVATGLYFLARLYVLNEAEKNIQAVLLAHRGMHRYIQEIMHPTFYKARGDKMVSDSFYSPEILSSSFIVRNQHGAYNEERKAAGLEEVYYKMAANNPRNPVNKADALEEQLIRMFNENREVTRYREVVTIDGKDYLYVAMPFLTNQERCMKCHGERASAPRGLQERYPGEGGFNEKVGEIRAIESIRAPLAQQYSALHIAFASVVVGLGALGGLMFFNGRLREMVTQRTRELEQEVVERRRAEDEVRRINEELEERVEERTAQIAAANQELDAFAYSVSHDLRAPLRGIDGFSLALEEDYGDKLDDAARDYIRRIRAGCLRMGDLIDDMLQLSRLSRGEIHEQDVDLSAMAGEIVDELRKGAPERRVEVEIVPGLVVRGDAVLLRAVMENLLGNAWKFTGKTEPARITVGEERKGGKRAIVVRDNGAGFDMAYANKLFVAFQRLHSPQEFDGTGIGLATVQRIIHRHGGEIWAEGEVGKGAAFFFTL
ncbi:MAG: sensor histidine kinase [Thermodesulfobacteriota bacterium]